MILLRGITLASAALRQSFSPALKVGGADVPRSLDLLQSAHNPRREATSTFIKDFEEDWPPVGPLGHVGPRSLVGFEAHGSTRDPKTGKARPALSWEDKFALLRAFRKVHGHCRVPPGYVVGGVKLGGWVETQRKEYSKHRCGLFSAIINDKRVIWLERVGFEWEIIPRWALSFLGASCYDGHASGLQKASACI